MKYFFKDNFILPDKIRKDTLLYDGVSMNLSQV